MKYMVNNIRPNTQGKLTNFVLRRFEKYIDKIYVVKLMIIIMK